MNQVKAAIPKLKDVSWIYSEVTDESVNEAAKQVVEVTNNTTSTTLEKASENEIAGFHSFMVRNLDNINWGGGGGGLYAGPDILSRDYAPSSRATPRY